MSFTREEAKQFLVKAIDDIYDHNPKAFRIEMEASVDTIPSYKVSYDGYMKRATYSPEDKEKNHDRETKELS